MTQAETVKKKKRLTKEDIQAMRKKDHRLVKGVFKFNEVEGGFIKFAFKKWPGEKIQEYSFYDGNTYTIPYMIAKHLNENCFTRQHALLLDANGLSGVGPGRKISRCSFISEDLNFVGDSEEN